MHDVVSDKRKEENQKVQNKSLKPEIQQASQKASWTNRKKDRERERKREVGRTQFFESYNMKDSNFFDRRMVDVKFK